MLGFLASSINPNKLKWMTIQVASAVVDCLIHKTKISWAKVLEQNIQTYVDKLSSLAISYLAAYEVNLYMKDDLLTKVEKKE
jgi:hypothetical protein